MGAEGSRASSLLYHRQSPSAVLSIEAVGRRAGWPLVPNHPLAAAPPRAAELSAGGAVAGRSVVAGNANVTHLLVGRRRADESPLYRNAVGDELVYVQTAGRAETSFGRLAVGAGDYVVIPAARRTGGSLDGAPSELLVLEAAGHVDVPDALPRRRRASSGGRAVLRARHPRPAGRRTSADDGPTTAGRWCAPGRPHPAPIATTRSTSSAGTAASTRGRSRSATSSRSPAAIHQPPPVHQTFAGPGFVVCSFVPRPVRLRPRRGEGPVPPRQRRLRRGALLRRRRLHEPQGERHRRGVDHAAPGRVHPRTAARAAWRRASTRSRTEEVAVMVDTFDPLLLGPAGLATEDPDYWKSWSR